MVPKWWFGNEWAKGNGSCRKRWSGTFEFTVDELLRQRLRVSVSGLVWSTVVDTDTHSGRH